MQRADNTPLPAQRVVLSFQVDYELPDVIDDGVAVIGGPGDLAVRHDDALEAHGLQCTSRHPTVSYAFRVKALIEGMCWKVAEKSVEV
jgi:hypothetical protein